MSGGAGQVMPTQTVPNGADKGPGQPTHTAMGTPIVYGKTYLSSPVATRVPEPEPLVNRLADTLTSYGGYGGDGGSVGNSGIGAGDGTAGGVSGIGVGSSDGVNGMDASSDAASASGGGGSGGK